MAFRKQETPGIPDGRGAGQRGNGAGIGRGCGADAGRACGGTGDDRRIGSALGCGA